MKNLELKRYKESQEKENRQKVLYALRILREATPSKIHESIEIKSKKDAKDYFNNHNISYISDSEEFQEKQKEFSMSIRTVKSILEKLTSENLVIHKKGGIYSLNESINKFILFPNHFGESMVYSIGNFFPSTIEKSLEEFVNRYGLFMIFAFLRLLELKSSKAKENRNDKKSFSNRKDVEEEEFSDHWLKDAVPLKLMFDLFASLYSDNKEGTKKTVNLKVLQGLNKIIETKYPLYYKEFNDKIKQNKKLKYKNNQERKKFDEALDKSDDFFEMEEKKEKLIHGYKSKPYELPTIHGNKITARMVPRDWWKQLAQITKESH